MNITGIHQIEMTSRCNLRCKYCVHPTMKREKVDMTDEVWAMTMRRVSLFVSLGTQGHELNLCGIGESTLHPQFCDWVVEARWTIGPERDLILATNGVGVTQEHAKAMGRARMKVWVSLHRPEKAKETVDLLREFGVLAGISVDPSVAAVDWAGQVDWKTTAQPDPKGCMWLSTLRGFVMSDGRISRCCFDGQGTDGVIGTVFDDMAKLHHGEYSLCESCHLNTKQKKSNAA